MFLLIYTFIYYLSSKELEYKLSKLFQNIWLDILLLLYDNHEFYKYLQSY